MWYTSVDGDEMRVFRDHKDVPIGWVRGMRNAIKIEKNRMAATGRRHTQRAKDKLSENAKRKMYYTSPDGLIVRAFYSVDTVPNGWVKGNKSISRNKKIGEAVHTRRKGESYEKNSVD